MEHNTQEILTIEQQRVNALLQGDIETLANIMHPDAIHISSNGSRANTKEWLDGRKNAKDKFATFDLKDDQTIRFYGNIAIIDGSYNNSKQTGDSISPQKTARYTRVYKKEHNKWKMIMHQATEINN